MALFFMVYGFKIVDSSMAICDVRNNAVVSYRRRNQLIYIESFQSGSSTFRNIQIEYGFVAVLFSRFTVDSNPINNLDFSFVENINGWCLEP